MSEQFDIVIVGAGPAGLAAGITAARRGASHLLLDRGHLANTIHRYQRGKHVMAEPDELPLQSDLTMGFEAGTREAILDRWASDGEGAQVNLRLGAELEVTAIEGAKGDFQLTLKNGQQLRCGALVLAIGLQGNLRAFPCPGAELPHVTYQLDDPAEHEGDRVVVVGVGDAGIENALALADHGNEVWIVNRRDDFDRAKARNRGLIEAAIRQGKVQYFPNTNVERFEPNTIVLATPEGSVSLEVERVIGRLGAIPPRKFLEDLGIEFPSKDPVAVPMVSDSYESSVPGIHLIGALAGYPLIKNCMNQGFEVVEHLLGNRVVPADEPLLEKKFTALEGSASEVVELVRERIPLFSSLTTVQLREFLGGSEVRIAEPGEVIFRRNEYSTEFYSILDGSVTVKVPASDEAADSDRGGEDVDVREIHLGTGDFFGEGSLISGRRRSGTVVAIERTELIQTPRSRMNALVRTSADAKRVLDTAFIARSLENFLPMVSSQDRQRLAQAAEVRSFNKGEYLFKEGDDPDGLHMIRRGSVGISHGDAGSDREVVLNYIQAGNYFGETALISGDHKRTASARAAVATETILLPTEVMTEFMAGHPELRDEFEARRQTYSVESVRVSANREATDLVGFLLNVGAGEATDLLIIDESLCIRCNNCEKACGETHAGVSRLDREGGPHFDTIHIPTACQHCENPWCMTDCPPDALRRHPEGEVYILDNCIGCGNCVSACPYNVIQLAKVKEKGRRNILFRLLFGEGRERADDPEAQKLAVKCDLCRNLPANAGAASGWAACVASCPTGAIVRADPRRLIDDILGAGG